MLTDMDVLEVQVLQKNSIQLASMQASTGVERNGIGELQVSCARGGGARYLAEARFASTWVSVLWLVWSIDRHAPGVHTELERNAHTGSGKVMKPFQVV
eukprot:5071589-Amphidinium_carterae.1